MCKENSLKRDWEQLTSRVNDYINGNPGADSFLANIVKATGEWRREKGFDTGWHNFAEKLMLIVTEIDEAREAKDLMSSYWTEMSYPAMPSGEPETLAEMKPKGLNGMNDAMEKFSEAADNYVEEWIDVMVRVLDLCEACGIVPEIHLKNEGDMAMVAAGMSVTDVVKGPIGVNRLLEAVRCASGAMEAFRDVKLEQCNENGESFLAPSGDSNIEDVQNWLSGVVSVASWAIEDMGEDWTSEYASKMLKNEARPSKHGRQR